MVDKLDEIRERWAKATPGPWKADAKQNVGENWLVGAILDCGGTDIDGAWANWIVTTDNLRASECTSGSAREDAEAIAAAPEDIQTLLAEVDRLRTEWDYRFTMAPTKERHVSFMPGHQYEVAYRILPDD